MTSKKNVIANLAIIISTQVDKKLWQEIRNVSIFISLVRHDSHLFIVYSASNTHTARPNRNTQRPNYLKDYVTT